MKKLSSNSILWGLTLLLLLSVNPVFACMCAYSGGTIEEQVKNAANVSSAVFVGKVIGFEYRKGALFEMPNGVSPVEPKVDGLETKIVKFRIEKWWKMAMPDEVSLITDITRKTERFDELLIDGNTFRLPVGESINMCHNAFVQDQTYLVYASGTLNKLQYRYCTRTNSIDRASEDLAVLGDGNTPKTKTKN